MQPPSRLSQYSLRNRQCSDKSAKPLPLRNHVTTAHTSNQDRRPLTLPWRRGRMAIIPPPAQVYNPSPPPPPSLSITSYCDTPFCPQYKIILALFSYTFCIISSFLLIPTPNQERAALPGTARVKRIPSTIKFNFFFFFFLLSINLFSRFLFKWFYWGKLCFFFCLGICPPSSVAFYLCVQKKGTLTVPWRYGSHGMW